MAALNDTQLLTILQEGNYITADDAAAVASDVSGQSATDVLLSKGLATKDLIGQAIAEHYGIPYADLNSHVPSRTQVRQIPEDIGQQYRLILFSATDNETIVTTDDPTADGLKDAVKKTLGKRGVIIAYSLPEDVDSVLTYYRQALQTRFSQIIASEDQVAPEIIDEIIEDAIVLHASDIHFEPTDDEVVIRFRIDGVLQEAGTLPRDLYDVMINRVKVQARLRIDEHFSAQDGAIRYETAQHQADLRVSIVPTIGGEKIVMRLLTEYVRGFTLSDLGLSSQHQALLQTASKKPFGMVVVCGPTGSGKTTTSYALLKLLNTPSINITTIEDPVEYRLPGTNQIQVNEAADITFSNGLRSIVRQDPDVILVGEIRDTETAEIAVNAALTGHLLLSTFHANDASTAVPRLLKMGIEPFLLSSTLELIIAQRLVRRICDSCRVSNEQTAATIIKTYPVMKPFIKTKMTLYQGAGCDNCHQTGYSGRAGIFEIIELTQGLRELILERPAAQEIWAQAAKNGTTSLFADGLEKVQAGLTTIDELLRVASPPEV